MKKSIFAVLVSWCGISYAQNITDFDSEILKSRGIDESVAQQLAQEPRLLPGKQDIQIYVNNQDKGYFEINITDEGEPCFTYPLLEQIGLTVPTFFAKEACPSLASLWPKSELKIQTTQQAVWLFVPEQAVKPTVNQTKHFIYGGNGILLNYNANYMGSSGKNRQDLYFINTETGFNWRNWIFRSAQMYNRVSDNIYRHQYAYAQTTLEKYQKNLQIGQINLQNSTVSAAKVLGFQLFPENKLEATTQGGAIVSGIAAESSLVEIYQSGQLIYQTAVPAGPFELSQFAILNRTADLNVKLNGVNGNNQTFRVPASTFLPSAPLGDKGYSFGIGRYDEYGAKDHPWVASVSKGWTLTPRFGVQVGGVITPQFSTAGLSGSALLTPKWQLSLNNNISHYRDEGMTGGQFSTNLGYTLNERLSLGLSTLLQTADYRYLSDTVHSYDDEKVNNKQRQFGGNLNWSSETLGNINLSVGRTYDSHDDAQDYVTAGWSRTFYGRYLFSSTFQRNYTQNNRTEDAIYLRLSIPFDHANLSTWLNHTSNHQRMGVNYQSYGDRDQNWGMGYEYNEYQHYQSLSANINRVTPYTQIGGNLRRSNDHQSDWGTSLTGGVAWVNEGILFSPYSIKETFGVAKAGDRRGVRLDSSAGTTWTNGKGYALLPNLESYGKNGISVDTRTLKRQYDILNAYKSVIPAKGSVVPVNFSIIETRRLMIATTLNQQPLPVDSVVSDEAGNFLTLATRPGYIFLGDVTPNMKLKVDTPDKQHCEIRLNLPKEMEADVLYEKTTLACEPIALQENK